MPDAHDPRHSALLDAGRADRLLLSAPGLESRELVGKPPGVGLFDLASTQDGWHACIFCGVCAKKCPVECITVRRDAKSPGEGRRAQYIGSIEVDEPRCITCGRCVEACALQALVPTPGSRSSAGAGTSGADGDAARRGSRPVLGLRRSRRGASGAERRRLPPRRRRRHRLPRGLDDALPVHVVEGQLHPHQLRERRGHALRRRDRLPCPAPSRQARRARQVHRLRRRRRHLRHRPPGALAARWSAATRCSTSATTTAPT